MPGGFGYTQDMRALLQYPTWFYRNSIINGNFDIWQRGTSFNNPNVIYTADRFTVADAIDTNIKISQSTVVPNALSTYSYRIETYGAPGGSGAFSDTRQYIENYKLLAGFCVTLSFMYKLDSGVYLNAFLEYPSPSAVFVGIQDGVWHKATLSVVLPSNITQLAVNFRFIRSQSAVGLGLNLSQIQLTIGQSALNYMPNLPADELLRCQRYFQRFNVNSTVGATLGVGSASGATAVYFAPRLVCDMRIVPNATLYDGGIGGWLYASDGVSNFHITSIATAFATNQIANIVCNVAGGGLTQFRPYFIRAGAADDAFSDIWLDAEL